MCLQKNKKQQNPPSDPESLMVCGYCLYTWLGSPQATGHGMGQSCLTPWLGCPQATGNGMGQRRLTPWSLFNTEHCLFGPKTWCFMLNFPEASIELKHLVFFLHTHLVPEATGEKWRQLKWMVHSVMQACNAPHWTCAHAWTSKIYVVVPITMALGCDFFASKTNTQIHKRTRRSIFFQTVSSEFLAPLCDCL